MGKNIILYANGTSENHGCEAITRSTVNMLDGMFEKIYCTTTNLSYESALPKGCNWVEYLYYRKPTILNRFISKTERCILKSNYFAERKPWLDNVYQAFEDCQVALSVGGDNYCNNFCDWLYLLHENARKKGLFTVLWGASLNEEILCNEKMHRDIRAFHLIFARESLTFKLASQFHENVRLCPDPAFTLNMVSHPWLGYAQECLPEFIGINASPTTMECEKIPGIVMENYCEMVEFILKETSYHIALIPHVVFHGKYGDYAVLQEIFRKYEKTGRMILIQDNDCCVLKGYISRCKFFVTARTHASIAAYSSCVPTLVLGYSIKAKGIAVDLFGTDNNYVLPVQEIRDREELKNGLKWLLEHEETIRSRLRHIMPGYIGNAAKAASILEKYCMDV